MASSSMDTDKLIKTLIFVFFAGAIIPIIGSQMIALEGDTTNFSATEIVLFGLVTTLIILGVVYTIAKAYF